ncbi:PAP2 superfamily protein [Mariniphaga anaerophila]|uniref:PAP2 superfamily protein n=1 Tax=Mariniphaga anaerophila TaxID=1484053 RepID=A0A1M4TPV2_9BACT|nr:phosphatase PAP2 family protein [Mariniphaga anaerophila]SHE46530.1 PAP2 superfamily protein [Mariniphaga anaerophila]
MDLPFLRILIFLQLLICGAVYPLSAHAFSEEKNAATKERLDNSSSSFKTNAAYYFHREDSVHRLNFRYPDKKRGLKPWIAPAVLISGGTALHFATEAKTNVRDFMQENLEYHGTVDDYLQYAPGVAVYVFNALGIKGKNNFGNSTALLIKSFLLNGLITDQLKYRVNEPRPNGGVRSFPSGHTSKAFMFAHFMHKEFGELSPWYSVAAYSSAATVAYMRVAKSAHWVSDVIAGAGIGILSTELVYLTHQYKWDNEHLQRFDIFPFRLGNQKGVTLVYNF